MPLPVSFSLSSTIKVIQLQELLHGYSSPIVKFLVDGFSFGFCIGFMGNVTPGCDCNNRSALNNEEAISTAILKEVNRGHTLGPFAVPPFAPFHCSPPGSFQKDTIPTDLFLISLPLLGFLSMMAFHRNFSLSSTLLLTMSIVNTRTEQHTVIYKSTRSQRMKKKI